MECDPNPCPVSDPVTCSSAVDVILLLDGSGSLGPDGWAAVKEAGQKIASSLSALAPIRTSAEKARKRRSHTYAQSERERERERQTDTDRQGETQTDTETHGDTQGERERERERKREWADTRFHRFVYVCLLTSTRTDVGTHALRT